jgi:hypothetical protein
MTKFDGKKFTMQLCFCFDKTSSMRTHIAAVGGFIKDAISRLKANLGKWLDFEFCLVGYRDFGESYDHQDFISDVQ